MVFPYKQTYYYTTFCYNVSPNKRTYYYTTLYCIVCPSTKTYYYTPVYCYFCFHKLNVLFYHIMLQDFFHQQTYNNTCTRYVAQFLPSNKRIINILYHVMLHSFSSQTNVLLYHIMLTVFSSNKLII